MLECPRARASVVVGGVGTGNVGWGLAPAARKGQMIRRDGTRRNGMQRLAWRDGDVDGGRRTRPPLSRPDPGVTSHGHGQAVALAGGLTAHLAFAPVAGAAYGTGHTYRAANGARSLHAAGARRVPPAGRGWLAWTSGATGAVDPSMTRSPISML